MTMQWSCHGAMRMLGVGVAILSGGGVVLADPVSHDYPTHARVEYVQECMLASGGQLAALHQCSCAIDEISKRLAYDQFVEATTYSRLSSLAGEGGAIFRDSQHAKHMAKLLRSLESEARNKCGLQGKSVD